MHHMRQTSFIRHFPCIHPRPVFATNLFSIILKWGVIAFETTQMLLHISTKVGLPNVFKIVDSPGFATRINLY